MNISESTIIAVKSIPITTLLEWEDIKFKRVGREAVTICPWHNDTNPSLTINDDKGFCFCFVCREGHDGIGFIQQKLGLSFADTIDRIALKAGIAIEYDNIDPEIVAKEARKRKAFYENINAEQEKYRSFLKDQRAERIRNFIDERGIEPGTCKHFGLGYAPSGFFADRITIPIHDHRGTLVGFTGRSTRNEIKPKYKNSENSEFFDKSKLVFNEYRSIESIRDFDSVIFVEGQIDVISLWQYGIRNVVALQGTASPSEAIIRRIAKRSKRFILCFDGDTGGQKATELFLKTAGPIACRGEINISIASLPDGLDPDECIKNSDIDFYAIIESAVPWLDWQLDTWLRNLDRTDLARFAIVEKTIRDFVNSIESPALRQYYIDKASRILANDEKASSQLAKDWINDLRPINIKRTWEKPGPHETRRLTERRLLRLYIHSLEARKSCRHLMENLQYPAHRWFWKRIVELEEYSSISLSAQMVMTVLAISEPHYTRQFRSLAAPNVKISYNDGILTHIEKVMTTNLIVSNI